jgi:hypothetical protein
MGLFSNVVGVRGITGLSKGTIASPDRRWWKFDGFTNPKTLSTLYSIGIMNLEKFAYIQLPPSVDPAGRVSGSLNFNLMGGTRALYEFPIPPQSYELSEPTTTQIVPTQDGGVFVESHGSVFKDIRVAGTVGLRPRPIEVGTFSGLSALGGPTLSVPPFLADLFLKDERGLDPKEITGFDDIIFLRNLFRAYSDIKKNSPKVARQVGMVWTYAREGEAWVVEPMTFTVNRDKSNPLSWSYNITMRTLYFLEARFDYTEDSLSIWQMIRNVINLVNKVAMDLASSINQLADAVNWLANLPANLMQTVLGAVSQILNAVANLGNAIINFPKVVSKTVVQTAHAFCKQLQILFDQQYPQPTTEPTFSRFAGVREPWHQFKVAEVRDALATTRRGLGAILAADKLWEAHRQTTVANYSKAYLNTRQEAPFTAGSPLALSNLSIPSSAKEVTVKAGDGIRSLAKEYLGDESYWKQLAMLNNLRPPYVSATSGSGVLGPGDRILVPSDRNQPTGQVQEALNTDTDMVSQSQVIRKYGRDVRLMESSGEIALSDLAVSSRGDLELIEGVPNVEQAMMIKFSTEQGELATHPQFGAQYTIGTKVSMTLLQEFAISVRRTLLSDPRVDHIVKLKIAAEGDRMMVDSAVQLIDSDVQLPISFAVRS